jgi:hypothetical protein
MQFAPTAPVSWVQHNDIDTLTIYVGDAGIYEFDFKPAQENPHLLVRNF